MAVPIYGQCFISFSHCLSPITLLPLAENILNLLQQLLSYLWQHFNVHWSAFTNICGWV